MLKFNKINTLKSVLRVPGPAFDCVPFVQHGLENNRNCLCMRRLQIARQGTSGNLNLATEGASPSRAARLSLGGIRRRAKQFAGNRGTS